MYSAKNNEIKSNQESNLHLLLCPSSEGKSNTNGQFMKKGYLTHMQTVKARASLCECAPEPSLFAHIIHVME